MSHKRNNRRGLSRRDFLKLAGLTGAAGALGAVGGGLLSGCTPKELTTSLQLGWIACTQYAGEFAADSKGYYTDEKLTVDIAPGGPGIPPQSLVDSRAKDIGIASSSVDSIKANIEGARLIAFASEMQRSPAGLMYIIKDPDGKPGTIIDTPEAAKGKRIGLQALILAWRVVCAKAGIDPETDMEIVTVGFDPTPLIDGTVDAYWGFSTNQKVILEKMGYEVGFLDAYEWGYKVPGNFVICHQDYYKENKNLLERFTRATIKGWKYALENPGEIAHYTVDHFGEKYGLEYENEYQQVIAETPFLKTPFTEKHGLMAVNMEDWENAARILVDMGEIDKAPDINKIATTEIIDAVYKNGRIDQ